MAFDYSRMTYNNRWRVKRWSHGARFQTALELAGRFLHQPRELLDYGAGDGHFAQLLRRAFAGASITAFDPSRSMAKSIREKTAVDPKITAATQSEDLQSSYDAIFCLEVLEHLQDREIQRTLILWRKLLIKGGVAIVSVPIEIGLGGGLKTIIRLSIGEGKVKDQPTWNVFKSLLGFRIDRGHASYIDSHIGFSHLRLKRLLLENDVTIRKTSYSPIRWAGSLNSQCFWVLSFD